MVSQGVAAGRFPTYTDADVKGALVKALVSRGWDVVRAVDAFDEGEVDEVHFSDVANEQMAALCSKR